MRYENVGSRMRIVGSLALGLALSLAACGSEAPSTSGSSTSAAASGGVDYEKLVPDREVTAGLAGVQLHAGKVQEVLPAEGVDAAKRHAGEMQEQWNSFEATVRKNEKDLYLRMEDALADVHGGARDNKPERVERGVKELAAASQAYLEKHP